MAWSLGNDCVYCSTSHLYYRVKSGGESMEDQQSFSMQPWYLSSTVQRFGETFPFSVTLIYTLMMVNYVWKIPLPQIRETLLSLVGEEKRRGWLTSIFRVKLKRYLRAKSMPCIKGMGASSPLFAWWVPKDKPSWAMQAELRLSSLGLFDGIMKTLIRGICSCFESDEARKNSSLLDHS